MSDYLVHLLAFFQWLGLSLFLGATFVGIYLQVTRHRELQLIREGNVSATVALSGAVIGYVLPLASAMVHGANLFDFLIWGLFALLVQILVYLVLRVCWPQLTQDIVEDRLSVAVMVALVSLATGILNAAAMFG